MLFFLKVKIEDNSYRYIFVEADNTEGAREIISEYNRKVNKKNYYQLTDIIYVKKITGYPKSVEYQEGTFNKRIDVKKNTINSTTKLKVIVEKLNLSKESIISAIIRYLINFGIGCLLTPLYINLLMLIENSNYLNSMSNLSSDSKELLFSIFIIGIGVLLIALQAKFFKTLKLLWVSIFLITCNLFVLILEIFSQKNQHSLNSFVLVSSFLWILIWLLCIESLISFLKITYKRYILLDNKEQFTIGISIFTFILGLLLAK